MPSTYSSYFKQQDKQDTVDALQLLCDALKAAGLSITDSLRDKVLKESLAFHVEHIGTLRVNAHQMDQYKMVSWFGYILASSFKGAPECEQVVRSTLNVLNYLLHSETPWGALPVETVRYMVDLVTNEINDKSHCGIGKNGLFLAFHTAYTMKRRSNKSFKAGWGGGGTS